MTELLRQTALKHSRRGQMRNLALQLAAQVPTEIYSWEEVLEIEQLIHEQMVWLYGQERDLRLVR